MGEPFQVPSGHPLAGTWEIDEDDHFGFGLVMQSGEGTASRVVRCIAGPLRGAEHLLSDSDRRGTTLEALFGSEFVKTLRIDVA